MPTLRGCPNEGSRVVRIFSGLCGRAIRFDPQPGMPLVLEDSDTVVTGVWEVCEHLAGAAAGCELLGGDPQQRAAQAAWLASDSPDPQQVEDVVRTSPYLCGPRMTLADIWVSVCLSSSCRAKNIPDTLYPHALSWIERVKKSCPAWMEVQYECVAGAALPLLQLAPRTEGRPRSSRHEAHDIDRAVQKEKAPLLA